MKNPRVTLAAIVMCAALLLPASLAAQATSPYYLIAGSAEIFNTAAYASFESSPGYSNGLCGPNHWSYKSSTGVVIIHDGRNSNIPDENATIWVSWNGSADGVTTPPTLICAFASLDAGVGVRAVLAVPQAVLGLTVAANTAGQNKVPSTSVSDVPIPADVIAALNGQPIGIAATPVRPEDIKFATERALTTLGTAVPLTTLDYVRGLGYGGAVPGVPAIGYSVQSSQSATFATPVDFALYGNDPITGSAAWPYWDTIAIGADPVLVFVNTSNSSTGHLGDTNLTNINDFVLAGLLDGTISRTRDLFTNYAPATLSAYPTSVFLREPISGVEQVVEFNITNSYRVLSSQEKNVTGGVGTGYPVVSPGAQSNPLSLAGAESGSGRYRTIGTSEEVSSVISASHPDSIGYALWSYGNYASVTSSSIARYLTVDGVDPLYSGPSANPNGVGVIPVKTGSTFPTLTFPNVVNGSYPIWTTLRFVVAGTSNFANNYNAATALASIAQSQTRISDFVPQPNVTVFHSHFYQEGIGPGNGNRSTNGLANCLAPFYQDQGGDVGGAVYPIQADCDSILDTSLDLIQRHQ
jgi:hypothetical protein